MSREKNDDLIYKALADSRRREILDLLKEDAKTTGDICDHFKPLDRCTVMQHLGVLEKVGLVFSQKKGRFRWNYLNAVPIRDIYDRWINQYASPNVELLTRLKSDLEK
ncbi:MAG TPA: helix-turn-helix domain-containing protein [Pyrinomonadaceae bacterium]|nr:helix-turn-helix domain-containing protein [Pyrinomonadaceae bacterium]